MDEVHLLETCIQGNRKSRSEFLDRYSRLIYSYIRRIVDIKGNQYARSHLDDIFHDLFCSLFADNAKKLRSFQARNGSSFASWLRQVTIHFTIDYLRCLRSDESADAIDLDAGFVEVLREPARSAADAVIESERLEKLRECVEKLDAGSRFFLEMHINQGVGLDDLRAHLKLSRGAIDMVKSRLISRLRDCFKAQGYPDA